MERLTGNDALGLMEAYSAVHQPTINEEQIWEEVETWVNGLVEEGYDLGDYTWKDMYEAYLSEGPYDVASIRRAQQVAAGADQRRLQPQTNLSSSRRTQDIEAYRRVMKPTSGLRQVPPIAAARPTPPSGPDPYKAGGGVAKFMELTNKGVPPLEAKRQVVNTGSYLIRQSALTPKTAPTTPGRSTTLSVLNQPGVQSRFIQIGRSTTAGRPPVTPGAGQRQPGIPASPPAPRSTTTSARPPAALGPTGIPASPPAPRSTTTAARPPAALGSTGMPLVGGIERRTPSSAELRAAQQARAGASRVSTAFAPSTGSLVSTPSVTSPSTTSVSPSVTATAFTPSATNLAAKAQQARKPFIPSRAPLMQRQMQTSSFNPFDIIMGHLINEGYADSEEDAAVIMVNMSEEWKQSIVEGYVDWFGGILKGSGKSPDVAAQERADMYAARQKFANVTGKPLSAAQSQRGINQAAATQSMRDAVEKQYAKDMRGGTWKEPINTSSRHARANTVRAARANMISTAATSRMPRGVSTGGLLDIRPVDSSNDPMPDIVGMARRRAERQFQSRQGVGGV